MTVSRVPLVELVGVPSLQKFFKTPENTGVVEGAGILMSPNISNGTIQMEVRNTYISCMDTAYVREFSHPQNSRK